MVKINYKQEYEQLKRQYDIMYDEYVLPIKKANKIYQLKENIEEEESEEKINTLFNKVKIFEKKIQNLTKDFELSREEYRLEQFFKLQHSEKIETIKEKKEYIIETLNLFIDIANYDINDKYKLLNFTNYYFENINL